MEMRAIPSVSSVFLAFMAAATVMAAGAGEGKFDEKDPRIQELRKLDYEKASYANSDLKTRVTAVIALNDLLNHAGRRAEARLKMLRAYLEEHKLKDAVLESPDTKDDVTRLSFEDGLKVAVAYVGTEKGNAAFTSRLPSGGQDVLEKYETSYLKLCRERWSEVIAARSKVEAVANFLTAKGKFDHYMRWATAEAAGQRREQEKAFQARLDAQATDEKARRDRAKALAEQRRRQANERELKRMEYAFKLKQAKVAATAEIEKTKHREDYEDWNSWGGYRRDVYVPLRRPVRPTPHRRIRPKVGVRK
jgi:hypothetical protein